MSSNFKFALRSVVKDTATGFEGIVVCRSEWTNGCVRYSVQAPELKDGKPLELVAFDEQDLALVSPPPPPPVDAPVERKGGPRPDTTLR